MSPLIRRIEERVAVSAAVSVCVCGVFCVYARTEREREQQRLS